jgi:hypothetical protein
VFVGTALALVVPYRVKLCALFAIAMALAGVANGQTIDRHPELKSRTVAWTAYDGSYLVDTFNRAEMLDFYWTVFAQPYPATAWTGSLNPPVAGNISELRRVREYAQLNAYRALNYSPPMSEDLTIQAKVQYAAMVLGVNAPKVFNPHRIDSSFIGYTPEAEYTLANSLIDSYDEVLGYGEEEGTLLDGSADNFIFDLGPSNADSVGHRIFLLHDSSIVGGVGAALDQSITGTGYNAVWNAPLDAHATYNTSLDKIIAYPAPGYVPVELIDLTNDIRWSFVPANDATEFLAATAGYPVVPGLVAIDTTVTAKINGIEVPVLHLTRNNPPGPLVWNFDPKYLDLAGENVADGTTVDIHVSNVAVLDPDTRWVTAYRDYDYTVIFFDETKIVPIGYSPKTPLVNLSTRGVIGRGEQQMIAGFIVTGTLPVRVALRTQGPGLKQFGLTNTAEKTHIRVYDAVGTLLGENTDWKRHQDWWLLASYGVAPGSESEAGMVLTLWPGSYSAVVSDDTGANGIGVVEAFNIDNHSTTRLGNLSTRGYVGSDDKSLIAGIIIREPCTIVVRTQGPALAKHGITQPVADTVLKIVAQSDGHTVAINDDWATDPANVRMLPGGDLNQYAPSDSREAARILTLPAGAYSALVSAKGSGGVGIVEVFDVAP